MDAVGRQQKAIAGLERLLDDVNVGRLPAADDVGKNVAHRVMFQQRCVGLRIVREDPGHPRVVAGQLPQPAAVQPVQPAVAGVTD